MSFQRRSLRLPRHLSVATAVGAAGMMAMTACSSSSNDSAAAAVPTSATAGFTVADNAFSFVNFATGYAAAEMNETSIVRMFGASNVCADTLVPCTLTPAANAWINNVNASMDGGRCEGFAVLSSLIFLGLVTPSQFGGASARDLTLDGNLPLQEEIAYWYATQNVTAVTDATKKLYAKDAVPFLASFLQPGTTDYYRLGFVRKTASGFTGGHAVVPTGYEQVAGSPGVYILHVYDNNFPDTDKTLTLDTVNNRWEYRGSTDPTSTTDDYVGTPANGNPLYFAPIKIREGVLACPFCKGATESQTTVSGSAAVSVKDGNGNSAGFGSDGSASQAGSGSIAPGFSDVDTWDNSPPVTFTLPAGDTTLTVNGMDATTPTQITQFGSGYSVQASGLAVGSGFADSVSIASGGSNVAYVSTSGTPVTLSTAVTSGDNVTYQITVMSPQNATTVSVAVDGTKGTLTAVSDGSAGQPVTVVVTKIGADGTQQTGTLGATGTDTGSITIDAAAWTNGQVLTGTQDPGNGGAPIVLGDLCTDGTKDGTETGTDCGGTCATRCATGVGCAVAGDCTSGFCSTTTMLCVDSACTDGTKDGTETDVDCGGACSPCATGKACAADTDCVTSACDATTLVCDANQCADGRKDGSETDVDCGGTCAARCAANQDCATAADCTTGLSCASNLICETAFRKVFVSSVAYGANFGGLTGADTDCQTLATAAMLPGAYKAYLSDQTTNAIDRLTASTQEYVLVDGTTEVAANATTFNSPDHLAAMDKTETGATLDLVDVWTGTYTTGGKDDSGQCASWTSTATGGGAPDLGISSVAGEGGWASGGNGAVGCDGTAHLYCIEQ